MMRRRFCLSSFLAGTGLARGWHWVGWHGAGTGLARGRSPYKTWISQVGAMPPCLPWYAIQQEIHHLRSM